MSVSIDKEDMKDLRLLNEAMEDARIVLKRLQKKHGHDVEALGRITSCVSTELWVGALETTDRMGHAIEASAKAYMRKNEKGPQTRPNSNN